VDGEEPAHRDGWFFTGDIGYLDEGGFLFIVDRRKEMIISGGFNVYPKEVEEALYEHPDVLEAVVIGLPDEKWIEAVHACVALRPGSATTAADLRQHCRQHLSPYKVPKVVHFEQHLPRTVVGKFDKRALRERLSADHV
jgi:acyl-CoA synthetase (AMP-forming)/AMP-acid ligase II